MNLIYQRLERPLERPRGGYKADRYRSTMTQTLHELDAELIRHGAHSMTLYADFTDRQLTLDGRPRTNQRPGSPGIIVKFESALAGGEVSYIGNRFGGWDQNLRAILKAVHTLRLVDDTINTDGAQFEGFKALPGGSEPKVKLTRELAAKTLIRIAAWPSDDKTLRDVMHRQSSLRSVYHTACKQAHPDVGGSDELMQEVREAMDLYKREHKL